MNLEIRILHARTKLATIRHLLSQYAGEMPLPDTAAHGLAYILDDIDADLAPLSDVPNTIGDWEPKADAS